MSANGQKIVKLDTGKVRTSEQPWFRIVVAILAIFVAGFSIANVIYYYKLSKGNSVSKGEGYAMLCLSVIILIPTIFVMIWAIFRGAPKKYQKVAIGYASGKNSKYDM
jgi:hypothetical protein